VQGTSANWNVYKIFPFMHSGMTTMTSRLGHEIPMPKLWSALLLGVESAKITGPVQVSDTLATLPWEYIRYAHPNVFGAYSGVPNDPLLQHQFHLWDTTALGEYADAHIRMDSVWAKYEWDPSIKNEVRVAIFDSGVHFTHEDFDCQPICPPATMNGTVVHLNLDFTGVNPVAISSNDTLDYTGHGTSIAGLIGAVSNNGVGISGVAGGNFEADITGALLQNYMTSKESSPNIDAISRAMAWAILKDSSNTSILNSSFGFDKFPGNTDNLLRETYRLAYKANIIAVNSRGNGTNDKESYPATFRDEWGISVGASGDDGHIATSGVNCGPPPPFGDNDQFTSSWGKGVDVLAPGVNPLLQKTPSGSSNDGYEKFGGTSGAAPQVAGLAAWVLNQTPYSLAVEDVERLIEYTAQDKVDDFYEEYPGYDDRSGWGLIDAGATLDLVHSAKVIRVQLTGANIMPVEAVDGCEYDPYLGCYIFLPWSNPDTSLAAGAYHYSRISKYEADFSIDLCQEWGASFSTFSDTSKTPFWVLNSISSFFGPPILLNDTLKLEPWDDARFEDMIWDSCSISGKLIGYKYEFLTVESGFVVDSIILPAPEEEDFFFSLLVKKVEGLPDTLVLENIISNVHEEARPAKQMLTLWPNPFGDEIAVQLPDDVNQDGQLQVFDLQGRLLFQRTINPFDATQLSFPTGGWPPGAYFIRFVSPSHLLTAKAIKF
jgi:subtilisin family serine protease